MHNIHASLLTYIPTHLISCTHIYTCTHTYIHIYTYPHISYLDNASYPMYVSRCLGKMWAFDLWWELLKLNELVVRRDFAFTRFEFIFILSCFILLLAFPIKFLRRYYSKPKNIQCSQHWTLATLKRQRTCTCLHLRAHAYARTHPLHIHPSIERRGRSIRPNQIGPSLCGQFCDLLGLTILTVLRLPIRREVQA